MNPNQPNEVPQVPNEPTPVPPAQPVQPVTPAGAPAAGPAPVLGSAPATPPAPQPAKSNNKMIIVIVAIIAGLAIIGVGVWLAITFLFSSIKLETFEGNGYSGLAPTDYVKKDSSQGVSFTEPEKEGETSSRNTQSTVSFSTSEYGGTLTKDAILKLYDETYTEENFTEAYADSADGEKLENFTISKDDYKGHTARKFSATVVTDGKTTGDVTMLMVFDDEKAYSVTVAAHASDPALARAVDQIINSLEIKG